MGEFAISFSSALEAPQAAHELAIVAEAELRGPGEFVGGILLSTAAAGSQGHEVGRLLAERWPGVELVGTSFEGLVADGRVWRDRPALGLLAWQSGGCEPVAFAFEPVDQEVERLAHEILDAAGRSHLSPSDLVILFPDAHGASPIEPMLPTLEALLGRPAIAGAAASGLDGAPARAWVGREQEWAGALIGLIVPGPEYPVRRVPLVRTARASRPASPWLEITACRDRWVDRLESESALDQVRQQLGLDHAAALEPHFSRILVRHQRPANGVGEAPLEVYDERYVVGVDGPRGAFSLPAQLQRGDQICLAWPDATLGREALRDSLESLSDSAWLLQFACRSRDAQLHGDSDLESAWVAAHAAGRPVLGTVAPFQIGPDQRGESRLQVHATVLAGLVRDWKPS
jgi:small ligand-binding sensory domain FIST